MYGPKVLRKSSINIRAGGGVFEHYLGDRRYKTALEIGTYRGLGSAALSLFCERVITIDLVHGKLEANREEWDRAAFWRSLGIDTVQLRQVVDDRQKAALVAGLDFDVAFIDGAHDAAGVAFDFSLVKRCGAVLFHDADDNGPERSNHVHEFIKTLPAGEVEFMDIFAMWRAPWTA